MDSETRRFTGQERDFESGLDYFGARHYSSGLGRFTSTDPQAEGSDSTNPQSWNRYIFTLNNPQRFIDPNGRFPVPAWFQTLVNLSRRGDPIQRIASAIQDHEREAEARNNAFLEGMGIEPDGVKLGMMPVGPGAFNLGSAARLGRVALDTNAIIARLEGGAAGAAAVTRAIGQRSPIVSITAVKEFLVKGNVSSLRAFLKETGGRLAKAGSKDLVKRLESLGLKRADAEVVASAIVEKVKLITNDKKVAKVVAEVVESF